MWTIFAFGSAFFAGVTSILVKCGIRKTDSTVATAIRTTLVLLFSWLMVFIVGSQDQIGSIGGRTLCFLILSGLCTGASWLCYFKALQLGDVNKVVPIDKSSVVLTILLAFLFLGEPIGLFQGMGALLIGAGTFLMIEKKAAVNTPAQGKSWLLYALGSAIFASLTSILGKVGIAGVESNLGTAIRTAVVLVMAWGMVVVTGKTGAVKKVAGKELAFICIFRSLYRRILDVLLSGLADGAGQRSGSHRQAEHSGHHRLLPAGLWGKADGPLRLGSGADHSRNPGDAAVIKRPHPGRHPSIDKFSARELK